MRPSIRACAEDAGPGAPLAAGAVAVAGGRGGLGELEADAAAEAAPGRAMDRSGRRVWQPAATGYGVQARWTSPHRAPPTRLGSQPPPGAAASAERGYAPRHPVRRHARASATTWCSTTSTSRSSAARRWSSPGPRARASRRCCAASTGSSRSTRARSASTGGPVHVDRPRDLRDPRRDRDGLPAVQPLPAHDRAREHHPGAARGRRRLEGGGPRARARSCSSGSGSPRRPTTTRPTSPAASSSESRSPGRWPWSRS